MFIPEAIFYILKSHNAILAGGSLVSQKYKVKINDWDIYFRNENDFNAAVLDLKEDVSAELVFTSKNAFTFIINNYKIQIIKTLFGEPADILNSFDLKICQIAYDLNSNTYIDYDQDSSEIEERDLDEVYNENYEHELSVNRLFKYQKKGFINKESILKYLDDKKLLIKTFNNQYYQELP